MANVVTVPDGIVVGSVTEGGLRVKGRLYTLASDFDTWPSGVLYAHNRGRKLLTLDGLAGFAHDTEGADHSDEYYWSRTLAGYALEDGVLRVYVCELPAEKLVKVAEKVRRKSFLEVRLDGELAQFIKREAGNRTFAVPKDDLELSAIAKNGRSEFGRDSTIRVYLPKNAEKYAANIVRINRGTVVTWFDHSKIKNSYMRIRPAGLGSDGVGVVAGGNFFGSGRARGE